MKEDGKKLAWAILSLASIVVRPDAGLRKEGRHRTRYCTGHDGRQNRDGDTGRPAEEIAKEVRRRKADFIVLVWRWSAVETAVLGRVAYAGIHTNSSIPFLVVGK